MRSAVQLGLVVLAMTQGQQTVVVSVPAWVTGGSCLIDGASARTVVGRSQVILNCASSGIARCDFENAEPLDFDLGAICTTGRVPALQAQRQSVLFVESDPVTLEWLSWPEGQLPSVLATRQLVQGEPIQLARGPDRFLRFSRPKRSPLTVASSDAPEGMSWDLPLVAIGGELLVAIAAALVRPVGVRLVSSNATSLGDFASDSLGRVRVPGLTPGVLTWRPIYVGGVTGPPLSAEVVAGRGTHLLLPRQDVGQLNIEFDPDLCAITARTVISALRKPNRSIIRTAVASGPVDQTCRQTFGGLPPGNYEVRAHGDSIGSAITRTVVVESQLESIVALSAPPVSLSGTILLGGRPYPRSDLVVRFRRADDGLEGAVSVPVLAAGAYSARLPAPGTYVVEFTVRDLPFVGAQKEVTVIEGQNFKDCSVEGGTLKVRIQGWDRTSSLYIQFSRLGPQPITFSSASFEMKPTDDDALELPGIAVGLYSLQARQRLLDGSTRRSALKRHEVTEPGPDPEVTLALLDYSAEISVSDGANQPIPTATLSPMMAGGQLSQVAPGVFNITSNEGAPGDQMFVLAPGYLATCVLAPPSGSPLRVVLQPGIRTVVEVISSAAYGVIPGRVTVPGMACPIELLLLQNERLPPETTASGEVVSRFIVTQLPAVAGTVFTSALEPGAVPLTRSRDGVVVIRQFRR